MSWLVIFPRLVDIIHGGFWVALPSLLKAVDLCWSDVSCSQQLCFCGRNNKPRYKGSVLCKYHSNSAIEPSRSVEKCILMQQMQLPHHLIDTVMSHHMRGIVYCIALNRDKCSLTDTHSDNDWGLPTRCAYLSRAPMWSSPG